MSKATCSDFECGRPVRCRGVCERHYHQLRKYGEIITLADKLFAWLAPDGDCLVWTRSRNQFGYGKIYWRGSLLATHRVAYELTHGPIPPGMQIDHLCFNAACANPEHLRAVTPQQNSENRAGASACSPTGVRGVFLDKAGKRNYIAAAAHNGKRRYVGSFYTLEEAEAAVIAARLELMTHNDVDRRDVPA